jgi:hypothetical protein
MLVMLFVSIIAYMLGRAFDINLLLRFSKDEVREVAITCLIVLIFLGSFSAVSSSAGFGGVLGKAVSGTAVSAPLLDVDQPETISGAISPAGPTSFPPYSYSWFISNSGFLYSPATQCAQSSGSGKSVGDIVTCSIAPGTLTVGLPYTLYLQETDSAPTPQTADSTTSSGITVSSQLTPSSTPTVSSATLTVGEPEAITSTLPSTGTTPYTYTWLVSINGGSYSAATQCAQNTGSNQAASSTVTCTVPANTLSGGNTYQFELELLDSATVHEVAVSSSSPSITVSAPAVSTNTPILSAQYIDVDQPETISALLPSAGTPPFSYTWYLSEDGGTYVQISACVGQGQNAGAAVSCAIQPGASSPLEAGHTYTFELETTDSSPTPIPAYSPVSLPLAVSSPLNAPSAPSATQLSSTLPSTGTPPYSYTWQVSTNGGNSYSTATQCMQDSGSVQLASSTVGCTIPYGVLSTGTQYLFRVEAADSATVREVAFSQPSGAVTSQLPFSPPIISSAPVVFTKDCTTLAKASLTMANSWILLSVDQNLFIMFTALFIAIQPGDFGPAITPMAGLSVLSDSTDGLIGNFAMFTGVMSILMMTIAVVLGIFYSIFPLFFYIGIVLRTIPFTRAAGGAFLGLFIAFYFAFPFLLYFFISPYSQAAVQVVPSSTLNLPNINLGSTDPSTFIDSIFTGLNIQPILPWFMTTVVEPSFYMILGVIFSLLISMDFMESLGDMLGSPALSQRGALRGLI